MDFIIFFLVLIVPGLIGALIASLICPISPFRILLLALIIDLITFIIMITGLYFIKGIPTLTELATVYFDCLSFLRRYALLSILISIILGVFKGIACRFICRSRIAAAEI